jgi:phage terminase large subunit
MIVELSEKQADAMSFLADTETNEVLFGGGAGGGKSALGCMWCIGMALKYKGSRGLIGRASLKTLRETTLQTFFEVAAKMRVSNKFTYIAPTTIRFKNGSEILLKDLFHYPSDPNFDELGSLELTYAFVDEANQITAKAKNILRSRIRFKLDEFKLVPKILFTCNPAKNWTKNEFYDLAVKKRLPKTRAFIQALADDNPFIFSGYRDSLAQLSDIDKQRLLHGNWDYDDNLNALMSADAVESLFTNTYVKAEGKKYLIADVARFGSDKTKIRIWHGYRVIAYDELSKKSTTQVALRIKVLAQQFGIPAHHILIDEDGVGGGVVDQIAGAKGFLASSSPINPAPNEAYMNLKSQCAYKLAELINNGMMYENASAEVRELLMNDLLQIREKNFEREGKRGLVPKEEVKQVLGRSPDDGDTYIMRMFFEVKPTAGVRIITGGSGYSSNSRSSLNI